MLPIPTTPVTVRPAVAGDLDFVDAQQKAHSKSLGFLQRAALQGKLDLGQIVVAEEGGARVGYAIGADRYFKRDEVGNVAQLCVVEGRRRGLIGATLLRGLFERWAWGCRLAGLWCAQDLEGPSRFWEAMGFVPLAYRAGSETKGAKGTPRIHIYWQRRVRQGDGSTPWWYPSQTGGGQIREDRVVLPIPAGQGWRDLRPTVLPARGDEGPEYEEVVPESPARRAYPDGVTEDEQGRLWRGDVQLMTHEMARSAQGVGPGGMFFQPPGVELVRELPKPRAVRRKAKRKRAKGEHDPRLLGWARDLRDAYLDHVNADALLLPGAAKYDVGRAPRLTGGAWPRIAELPPGAGDQRLLTAA